MGDRDQMRALKIGASMLWPESKRKAVYVTAKGVGISVTVRKVGADLIKITRVSVLDKPRIECCSECGRRRMVRAVGISPGVSPDINDI